MEIVNVLSTSVHSPEMNSGKMHASNKQSSNLPTADLQTGCTGKISQSNPSTMPCARYSRRVAIPKPCRPNLAEPRRSPLLFSQQLQLKNALPVAEEGPFLLPVQRAIGGKRGRTQFTGSHAECTSSCKGSQICPSTDVNEFERERKRSISFKVPEVGMAMNGACIAAVAASVEPLGQKNNSISAGNAPPGDNNDNNNNGNGKDSHPRRPAGILPALHGSHKWRYHENRRGQNFTCTCPEHSEIVSEAATWPGPSHFCLRCSLRVCTACNAYIDHAIQKRDHELNCPNQRAIAVVRWAVRAQARRRRKGEARRASRTE
ncbi:hypothetical protein LTR78_006439 [Recurvomyces mirabilis]|uniref:Uncharacterized protein n=1 Tax=Recurvomyces mirabilis TaxID=574656 RepID=A0AAE1BZQ3_9PEZI|nr:hypothetical protein LTR78_006439 [Recurvomyces mirabilis]KAK5151142.1 hypothetical protein LTS14_009638 [Recurvomyces mirabilis]